ncbi:hypothetical protein P4S81_21460 [Pseudoalteromonas sp. B28]
MRYLLIILLLFGFTVNANQLCPINVDIAEDMRINEADFTKEKAEASVKYLAEIVKNDSTPFEWFSIPNAIKFIHGYALRRKALLPDTSKHSIEQFCKFYAQEGWYYD